MPVQALKKEHTERPASFDMPVYEQLRLDTRRPRAVRVAAAATPACAGGAAASLLGKRQQFSVELVLVHLRDGMAGALVDRQAAVLQQLDGVAR